MKPIIEPMTERDVEAVVRLRVAAFFEDSARTQEEDASGLRMGIGSALVAAIEAHAASIGVERLYLYTWEARDFYAGLGWAVVEPLEQDGHPMLLMSRELRL